MSHTDVIDFCGFFSGGYLAVTLLLLLASAVSRRAEWLAAHARRQWPLAFLAFAAASGLFFFGSHWDGSGTLVAADGRHFADGCPIGGLTLARLQAAGSFGFEWCVLLASLAVLRWGLRKPW